MCVCVRVCMCVCACVSECECECKCGLELLMRCTALRESCLPGLWRQLSGRRRRHGWGLEERCTSRRIDRNLHRRDVEMLPVCMNLVKVLERRKQN